MAEKPIFEIAELLSDLRTFIAVLDLEGHLVYLNPTPLELLEVRREDMMGSIFWANQWFS
ncbi:MAG: PAS domain-containing protein [Immundisolibacteraceae bacterium]|nr:PAS domain-containing protein [Immundisolibacteraceae bacterium]